MNLFLYSEELAEKVDQFFETRKVHSVLMFLILINAVLFAFGAIPDMRIQFEKWLEWGDQFILSIFIVELTARIIVTRHKFFKNYWNIFDLVIIIISIIPSEYELSSIRVLRVLHSMQLLELIPSSKHILDSFMHAIPGLTSVLFLCFVFIYAFSLMATHLYGSLLPEDFGHIGLSLYTLFTMLTARHWLSIINKIPEAPHAWVFFSIYAVVVGICIYNMVIGAIVSAVNRASQPTNSRSSSEPFISIKELEAIKQQLADIQKQLKKNSLSK